MNKRLTLLTKIENQQFANPEVLNLNLVVKKRIQNFNEIFPDKIKFEEANILEVLMDHYLAEVLCDNLISNALKYSAEKKAITISIGHKTLMVSNQGEAKLQNPEKLFTRFYRETSHIKSTGLGLAIVQKICDLYGYKPSYSFADHRHIFKVEF
jgi:signal transduction histidine kinase